MAEPHIHIWPQRHLIYRIHAQRFGAAAFNDSGAGDARFSPLQQTDGGIITTLYGGSNFNCAAMETIFHALPRRIDDYILDFDDLYGAVVSHLRPKRDLHLLSLTSRGLIPLGLKKTDVIETTVSAYPHTRTLALQWHQAYPDIDGLYWVSRQDDQAQACMLFGDRVDARELDVRQDAAALQAPPQLQHLMHLAQQLGIRQGRSFPSSIVGF
jgi:hypothetical protein